MPLFFSTCHEAGKLPSYANFSEFQRGTIQPLEWANILQILLVSPSKIIGEQDDDTKVHQGFYSIYTSNNPRSPFTEASARDQVLVEIRRLVEEYQNEEISIIVVGHSLGATIATLNAFDITANGFNIPRNQPDKACPVTAFVFASPRVGDSDFKKVSSGLKNLHILRIHNALDIVPKVPFIGYKNVGEKLVINTTKSEYLKRPGNLQSWHNLEAYLHGVAAAICFCSDVVGGILDCLGKTILEVEFWLLLLFWGLLR
ncbi:Phospholipase A1-IIgamma [Camellia lanceoleosa]|uniref:Phospholipase A1-IIgamma n=1 Tax=Camellia lanceoleosa TaxID=1840588 RepID=A0ACC0FI18_9ERIC|nr:Phospholipase A1-IIgamma [Camellia lanceoleosa]